MTMQPLIKVCGVRDATLAADAVKMGVEFIGLMQFDQSKRYIDIEKTKEIAKTIKNSGGTPVAVFVDADAKKMLSVCEKANIDTVQLHGSVSRKEHDKLPSQLRRIYVIHVNEEGLLLGDPDGGADFLNPHRDLLLFDREHGGNGKTFIWNNFVNPYEMPYFLAGGLSPHNVMSALLKLHPDGVDVSSGVERTPGKKDKDLIQSFVTNVKEVNI